MERHNITPDREKSAAQDAVSSPGSPPVSPQELLERLDSLGIAYSLYEHPPIFTVAEGLEMERDMPGIHCRNLFLRDKKKAMFLISAANETVIDLKKLETLLPCDRISFGSPDRLWDHLGVRPGSVCPYALINDRDSVVTPILDAYMMQGDIVNFHPLINTMTIGVSPAGLLAFYRSIGREPRIVDFS
jgi:Ala-tRNA(Pro) deacylase